MIHACGKVRRAGAMLALAAVTAMPLGAQESRDSLVARAQGEFDATRRVQLLRTALDPAASPLGQSWATGAQLMAQTLLDGHQDSLAYTWLRWAVRLSPSLAPDTVQFLPAVAAALRGAEMFVRRTSSAGDTLVSTSWRWPSPETQTGTGAIEVTAPDGAPGVRVAVTRVGGIALGESVSLAPGSYEVRAGAAGGDSVAVTREVLPGVTTVLAVKIRSVLADVPVQPQKPTVAPVVEPRRKKFPWAIVAIGAAGAGAAVALLSGGGEDTPTPPQTGTISISFPNP